MLGLLRKADIQQLITCLVTCKWKVSFGVVRQNVLSRHKRKQYMMSLFRLEPLPTLLASRMMPNSPLLKALKNMISFYYAAVKSSHMIIILRPSSDMKVAKKVTLLLSQGKQPTLRRLHASSHLTFNALLKAQSQNRSQLIRSCLKHRIICRQYESDDIVFPNFS